MIETSVILNKWLGNRFENDTECDSCGKQTSVMSFKYPIHQPIRGVVIVNFCPICLDKFSKEITDTYCERMYKEANEKCQNT
jgi:hypothetical protein